MARFNIYLDDKLHREVCEHIPKRARSRIVQHAYRAALRICADMAKTTDVITSNELIRRIEDEPRAHLSEGAIKEWASDKGHPGIAEPFPVSPAPIPPKLAPWATASEIRTAIERGEFDAITKPPAPRKLARVTRALLLDAIENALRAVCDHHGSISGYPIEKETEVLCEKLLRILDNDD